MGQSKHDFEHAAEESERITDLLRREKPKSERAKEKENFNQQKAEMEAMDEELVRDIETEGDNTKLDLEAMQLELREVESIYGAEKKQKDQFFFRREQKNKLRSQGGVKKESPIWDDED